MNFLQPIAGFIFRQGAKAVASEFVLKSAFNFLSRRFVGFARDWLVPKINGAVEWFAEWDYKYLPRLKEV